MESRWFLTVDWCNNDRRGIFCDNQGNPFSLEREHTRETQSRPGVDKSPVYLVMALRDTGQFDLLAIDTENWIARRHKTAIERSAEWGGSSPYKNVVRVWIEKRMRNHLLAFSMTDPDGLSELFTEEEFRLLYGDEYYDKLHGKRS